MASMSPCDPFRDHSPWDREDHRAKHGVQGCHSYRDTDVLGWARGWGLFLMEIGPSDME